jgi:hypothetical protein
MYRLRRGPRADSCTHRHAAGAQSGFGGRHGRARAWLFRTHAPRGRMDEDCKQTNKQTSKQARHANEQLSERAYEKVYRLDSRAGLGLIHSCKQQLVHALDTAAVMEAPPPSSPSVRPRAHTRALSAAVMLSASTDLHSSTRVLARRPSGGAGARARVGGVLRRGRLDPARVLRAIAPEEVAQHAARRRRARHGMPQRLAVGRCRA